MSQHYQPGYYPQQAEPAFAPQPQQAVNPVYAENAVWSAPTPPTPKSTGLVLSIIGISVLGFVFLAVLAYVAIGLGPVALVVCGLVALIPLSVVILTITWIDRWEPEPRGALWFAFLWGAAASVAIALLVGLGIQLAVYYATEGQGGVGDFFSAVIQAPLVEESAKGLGVLILFFVLRRHFDGPIDGLVYGATVAAGFAFTENILYFGSSLIESGGVGLGFTFFLRGIMSPFAHVMFTACTGVALGFASQKKGWLPGIGFFFIGLVPAALLHALWNGSSFIVEGLGGFFLVYAIVQVPLFALAIIAVVFLRKREAALTRVRLEEYASAGWFTPEEVAMLSTGAGRRQARAWAAAQGGDKGRVMRRFTLDATRLAFARQRVVTGRDGIGGQRDEADLLRAVAADRASLLASVPQGPAFTAPQQYPQQPSGQYDSPSQPQQGPPVI
ncbi:PrsW family intramembrane metalloprotease [Agreia pratensis]|uniref:Membrane proteinase PrsW, cleaves anti-sigma factor RsiW, M82 family n=1 Tax=Agreia pratensis TaxID=150121 RepID=A0A1X7K7D0_9MICO|nr:PrsW family intramembrane metalloprotease [Agreia pratensis]SMG36718.1 Membrane proteinase PrsW, cleaves anti-sigma factor RsiW, M82 family [Agreia pratensis]